MKIQTKYSPKDIVLINGVKYEILSCRIYTTAWGSPLKLKHSITYHVQDRRGNGTSGVMEQFITKKSAGNLE